MTEEILQLVVEWDCPAIGETHWWVDRIDGRGNQIDTLFAFNPEFDRDARDGIVQTNRGRIVILSTKPITRRKPGVPRFEITARRISSTV